MIGHGATLSGATTTLGKLTNIQWSGVTVNSVDTTEYDSTGAAETSEGGTLNYGSISASMNFDKAQVTSVLSALAAKTAEVFTFTLSDGSTFVGSGWFSSLGVDTPLRENVAIQVTIQLTGALAYTAAT